MARRIFQILTGVMAGLAVVAVSVLAGWLPGSAGDEDDPHLLTVPFPAGDLGLTTHEGRSYDRSGPEGLTVVFFGYSHCPDICPLTLANLRRALDDLERVDGVSVLFVTVDPARDDEARLAAYLAPFQPGFTGLTGSEAEIAAVAESWGIFRHVPPGAENYTVDHTGRVFVVDEEGRVRATFSPNTRADVMAGTVSRLLNEG